MKQMKTTEPTDKIWKRASLEPPEDNQLCHIRGSASFIKLDVVYKKDPGGWVDLFATPKAGAFFGKDAGVVAWCPAERIPGYPDAWNEDDKS
jgi:hypothetical protein